MAIVIVSGALAIDPPVRADGFVDLVTNVRGRDHMTLNGAWRSIMDPYQTGYYNYRYQPYPEGQGFSANRHMQHPGELIEYAFDESPVLYVPGDWNSQRDELAWYEGTIWYERDFDYELPPGRRLFVHVGAANYEAIAWMNGRELGRHEGGQQSDGEKGREACHESGGRTKTMNKSGGGRVCFGERRLHLEEFAVAPPQRRAVDPHSLEEAGGLEERIGGKQPAQRLPSDSPVFGGPVGGVDVGEDVPEGFGDVGVRVDHPVEVVE